MEGKGEATVCAKNYNLLHTASRSPKNAPSLLVPSTHPLNLPPLCQARTFRGTALNRRISPCRILDIPISRDIELSGHRHARPPLLLHHRAACLPLIPSRVSYFFTAARCVPRAKSGRRKKVGIKRRKKKQKRKRERKKREAVTRIVENGPTVFSNRSNNNRLPLFSTPKKNHR